MHFSEVTDLGTHIQRAAAANLFVDTGAVCDIDAIDFNVAVDIILYVARLAVRVCRGDGAKCTQSLGG